MLKMRWTIQINIFWLFLSFSVSSTLYRLVIYSWGKNGIGKLGSMQSAHELFTLEPPSWRWLWWDNFIGRWMFKIDYLFIFISVVFFWRFCVDTLLSLVVYFFLHIIERTSCDHNYRWNITAKIHFIIYHHSIHLVESALNKRALLLLGLVERKQLWDRNFFWFFFRIFSKPMHDGRNWLNFDFLFGFFSKLRSNEELMFIRRVQNTKLFKWKLKLK